MNWLVEDELDAIARAAREGLAKVWEGENLAIDGWLEYGVALNDGRKMFPSDDRAFGRWLTSSKLDEVHPGDSQAAMWGAENEHLLADLILKHPKVRTLRGLHAKWKNPGPEPKREKRAATLDDLRKVERLRALRDDPSATEGERNAAQAKFLVGPQGHNPRVRDLTPKGGPCSSKHMERHYDKIAFGLFVASVPALYVSELLATVLLVLCAIVFRAYIRAN